MERPTGRRSKPSCRRCASRSAVLDKAVAKTGHLVDEQFTFADINLLPILHRVGQVPEGAEALAAATHLAAITTGTRRGRVLRAPLRPPGPPRRAKPG